MNMILVYWYSKIPIDDQQHFPNTIAEYQYRLQCYYDYRRQL